VEYFDAVDREFNQYGFAFVEARNGAQLDNIDRLAEEANGIEGLCAEILTRVDPRLVMALLGRVRRLVQLHVFRPDGDLRGAWPCRRAAGQGHQALVLTLDVCVEAAVSVVAQ